MSRILIIFLKGIVGIIWFVATIITSVILSPFVLAAWISGLLEKKQKIEEKKSQSDDEEKF